MNVYDLTQWGTPGFHREVVNEEVYLVAVGGFPVVSLPGNWRAALKDGFGQGAVMTFGNPHGKSLEQLADMCGQRQHLWWLGGLSMTWLVVIGMPSGKSPLVGKPTCPGWESFAWTPGRHQPPWLSRVL